MVITGDAVIAANEEQTMQLVEQMTVRVLPDGRVSRRDAAAFLGMKPKTLAEWQRLGKGPRSCAVGGRRFYMLDELKRFALGEAA